MKDYFRIETTDLNTSLVFYRALLGSMPLIINGQKVIFDQENVAVELVERTGHLFSSEINYLKVNSKDDLHQVHSRIERFLKRKSMVRKCVVIDSVMAIQDPDGNKWIVGLHNKASFDECYLKNFNLNQL